MDWGTKLQQMILNRHSQGLQALASAAAKDDSAAPSKKTADENCGNCEGGFTFHKDERGYTYVEECPCQLAKKARRNLAKSGLAEVIDRFTFDNFTAAQPWQKTMLATVKAYSQDIKEGKAPWLYIGGQVGCGKTHLCTALAGDLLQANIAVKYAIWPGEVALMKAYTMDGDKRQRLMDPLTTAPLLYVDDFLKTANRGEAPAVTDADIRLAFELFNLRYTRNLPTVISCEWPLDQLMGVDEGTISRIYEKSRGYRLAIGRDGAKNYRIRGME